MTYPAKRLKPQGAAKREATRLRVNKWRKKQREQLEENEAQEKLFSDMREQGLLYFSEKVPTHNCETIAEEISSARRFARLLTVRDIQPREILKEYILTVINAWITAECPLLDTGSETLSDRKMDPPDIEKYEWLPGSDDPFQPEAELPAAQMEETNATNEQN